MNYRAFFLSVLPLKENTASVTEIQKQRSKRNTKFCFCKHTELENRKAEINNNNNKKMPHPFGLKYTYI